MKLDYATPPPPSDEGRRRRGPAVVGAVILFNFVPAAFMMGAASHAAYGSLPAGVLAIFAAAAAAIAWGLNIRWLLGHDIPSMFVGAFAMFFNGLLFIGALILIFTRVV